MRVLPLYQPTAVITWPGWVAIIMKPHEYHNPYPSLLLSPIYIFGTRSVQKMYVVMIMHVSRSTAQRSKLSVCAHQTTLVDGQNRLCLYPHILAAQSPLCLKRPQIAHLTPTFSSMISRCPQVPPAPQQTQSRDRIFLVWHLININSKGWSKTNLRKPARALLWKTKIDWIETIKGLSFMFRTAPFNLNRQNMEARAYFFLPGQPYAHTIHYSGRTR